MPTLLERSVMSVEHRLVVLAPPGLQVPRFFRRVTVDDFKREELLSSVQRLRGSVYVADGAIRSHELQNGRHVTPEDQRAWHIITRDPAGEVTACSWYLEHPNASSIGDVRAKHCPLHRQPTWREKLRAAVSAEMAAAKQAAIPFAEVGGWAVAPEHRCSSDGLIHVFAMFSLSLALGGAIGLTTATVRHSSSTILRRMGMAPLALGDATIPTYFDPSYQCDMELLRFDTRKPGKKYTHMVERLRDRLESVSVFANQEPLTGEVGASHGQLFQPSAA